MRPVSVFAISPSEEMARLRAALRGRLQAERAVLVLLSVQGLSPAQIAVLLECHPVTGGAGSAGSTPRAWPGWLTGPGQAVPGWAGDG
jgi:hypothetical protein